MKLTVIIIFSPDGDKKDLERARRSVEWADEVLVVGAPEPIGDFARVRNEALDRAKGEWVMFVDSDEEVSGELKEEIRKTTDKSYKSYKNYNTGGAYFKRRDRFLGRWLKHGETAGVRLLRLGRKDAGRWERPVHEVWKVAGRTGEFEHPILHYSHENVDDMVGKLDWYSEIEAEYRLGDAAPAVRSPLPKLPASRRGVATAGFGRASGFLLCKNPGPSEKFWGVRIIGEMILYPSVKFVQNYFWRLGFLDGIEGLIHASMMSGHSLLVRGKILERS